MAKVAASGGSKNIVLVVIAVVCVAGAIYYLTISSGEAVAPDVGQKVVPPGDEGASTGPQQKDRSRANQGVRPEPEEAVERGDSPRPAEGSTGGGGASAGGGGGQREQPKKPRPNPGRKTTGIE